MNRDILMDAIGDIDDKYILEYENIVTKRNIQWAKIFLPIAVCLAIAFILLPGTKKANCPDLEYEARHKYFKSISEAEQELGEKYLFSFLSEYENASVLVAYVDKESTSNPYGWTEIDVFFCDDKERISMNIYSSLFTGNYSDHLSGSDYETVNLGGTAVRYRLFGPGSGFSDYREALFADFNYEGCHYVFTYHTNDSIDKAYIMLKEMLDK